MNDLIISASLLFTPVLQVQKLIRRRLSPRMGGIDRNGRRIMKTRSPGLWSWGTEESPLSLQTPLSSSPLQTGSCLVREVFSQSRHRPSHHFQPEGLVLPSAISQSKSAPSSAWWCFRPLQGATLASSSPPFGGLRDICLGSVIRRTIYIYLAISNSCRAA